MEEVGAELLVHKRALRAEMRQTRRAITADPADRLARSARIWAGIVSLTDPGGHGREFETDATQIMLFEGLATEPATEAWFDWCAAHGVRAYSPEVDGPDLKVMPGEVDPKELDVVVVPGLAFTPDGRRLGQGGGHYDRFVARLRPDCVTIGACFHEQLVVDLPTEPHDRGVDYVVTDSFA
jgi:5-formyltetrahydrofolate cyclo-ligase